MLTTGVRLRGRAAEQRRLIAELAENEVSALGFAEEVVFKQIPEAIMEEAEARSFPVFAVPLQTGFREVIGVVNRSILSSEFRAIQRLTSIQRYLLDAYEEADPRLAVIERLARVLDVSVTLIVAGEATEQTSLGCPVERIEATLLEQPPACVELELAEWHLFAVPIPAVDGWLVAASRRQFVNALTKPAMQSAVPLLVAARRIRQAARRHEEAVKAALLEDLVSDEIVPADHATLRVRARAGGLDLTQPGRVLVLARQLPGGDSAMTAEGEEAASPLRPLEAQLGAPPLASSLPGGEAVAFLQVEAGPLREALQRALAHDPHLLIGVGRVTTELPEIRESFRDARQAVERLRRGGPGTERVLEFDAFDLGSILVADAREERIRPKLEETLSLLRSNPHLYEALVAYFEYEMDVAVAAESLSLHTNSLRYRLGRIESLLGRSLKSPATIANLYLALSVDHELNQDRAVALTRGSSPRSS